MFKLFYCRKNCIAATQPRSLIVPLLVSLVAAAIASRFGGIASTGSHDCRSIPGDSSWPEKSIWADLNRTVHGKLIATVPIAAPCHKTVLGEANPLFDEETCARLRDNWFYPETHLPSPSSPMAYPFTNNTCNPFQDYSAPCTLGPLPVYTINATGTANFQAAIRFAKDHNVRLVVRNTGHDWLGKSTGAHSLAVWTHYMKSIELVRYSSPRYAGPALKVGAGVEAIEAYKFADSHGLMVVGGNCPTVGLAGGFTQGGGHGPLASKYGLSADQVLEWEVVTGTGEIITATATQNEDLFWALRGGGGGTFGIVSALTVKAFPDASTSLATMMVINDGTNADSLYSAIGTFIRDTLPGLVDAGAFILWVAGPFGFLLTPVIAPGVAVAEIDRLLQPLTSRLDDLGLVYQYSSNQYPTFLSSYEVSLKTGSWNVSEYNLGSRLIPRDLVVQNTDAVMDVIRYISSQTLISGVSYNLARGVSSPDEVAVNPNLRSALFSLTLGTSINYTDWAATKAAQDQITNDFIPALERITLNGAAYLNEADFQEPNFQHTFYGNNYGRLLDVKHKYDPDDIFYAKTAVGSDRWAENAEGRLCRVNA
ncbi:FAD-binding domain-containing protein [Nemania sp. NC0429]|nr:FAD-binding domain-containing protein [Nemania sp. NC0429]